MFKYIDWSVKKIFPYNLKRKSILIHQNQKLKVMFLGKIKTSGIGFSMNILKLKE